jgi:tetratricopeptide (TPR) repeat protein
MLNRIMRLQRQLRARPSDARLWCELGRARISNGALQDAEADLDQALTCVARQPDVWLSIGLGFAELGLLDRARAALGTACTLDSASVDAHVALGRTLLRLGHAESSATVLAAAVWLDSKSGPARAALAGALIALDRYEAADIQLDQALDDDPDCVDGWLVQAELYRARSDQAGAVEALQRAFALDPRVQEIGLGLAEALGAQGRHHEAFSVLQELRAHHPEDSAVLSAIGRTEFALGRIESAIGTLRRAANQGAARAWFHLAEVLEASGRHFEVIEALRTAHKGDRSDADVAVHLGRVLADDNAVDEAVKVVARAIMSNREDARLHGLLSELMGEGPMPFALDLNDERPDTGPVTLDSLKGAAFTGDLSEFNLVDLLEFLRLNRRTGKLRCAAKPGVGELLLVEGRLVGGTTTNTGRLGDRLRDSDLVAPAALEEAVALQQSMPEAPALGRILLEQGSVGPKDLREALFDQVMAAVKEIVGWAGGRFAFEADENVRHSLLHPDLELNTVQIMLEVVRIMDEDVHGATQGETEPSFNLD